MHGTFGKLLKDWRSQRRMSQLDLGLAARVSARHISFLETGRAQPSRSMVAMLSETLQIPRGQRNTLLSAAGFSTAYPNRGLDGDGMEAIRAAVEWTLGRHDPFPAMALDRHWKIVKANGSARVLLGGLGLREGESLLDAAAHSETLRSAFDDWPEAARHLAARLRMESAHLGGDAVLDEAAKELAAQGEAGAPGDFEELPAVMSTRYRMNGAVYSFFSTVAQFSTAEDIALADLKIELMFPADEATKSAMQAIERRLRNGG
jgi:transcriptional regulator with XRE-family HTH domain